VVVVVVAGPGWAEVDPGGEEPAPDVERPMAVAVVSALAGSAVWTAGDGRVVLRAGSSDGVTGSGSAAAGWVVVVAVGVPAAVVAVVAV